MGSFGFAKYISSYRSLRDHRRALDVKRTATVIVSKAMSYFCVRRARVLWFAALLLGAWQRILIAQETGVSKGQIVDVDISNWRLRRNISLITAGGQTINRLAEIALDELMGTPKGSRWTMVIERATRVYFVVLPVAALTQLAVHEEGHIVRGREVGRSVGAYRVSSWPWPVPVSGAISEPLPPIAPSLTPADDIRRLADDLTMISGGEEASLAHVDALADAIYRGGASVFDSAVLVYAKLDMPVYTWVDLRPAQLTNFGAFFRAPGFSSDPAQYALTFAQLGGGGAATFTSVREAADEIRRGVWLNLVDYSLWAAVTRVVDYVISGDQPSRSLTIRINGIGFVPAMHFAITPLGFERGVNTRIVYTRQLWLFAVRWLDTPSNGRLWGGNVAVMRRLNAGGAVPEVRADVWQRKDETLGFRVEGGTGYDLEVAQQSLRISVTAGYKTRGYLAGAPLRSGVLVAVGCRVQF